LAYVHRLITLGTPHKGIDSDLPSFLEESLMTNHNLADTAIFRPKAMREYLSIPPEKTAEFAKSDDKDRDLALIGWQDAQNQQQGFPPERCLCLVGSDHPSYEVAFGLARRLIGSHSDGLVKQSNAYIQNAYYANVHRAHSGFRGIVNSAESYHNIRRFLFGNLKFSLWLEQLGLKLPRVQENTHEQLFFNIALAVRGTGIYLHQREQTPCENGIPLRRTARGALEYQDAGSWVSARALPLHTGFLDSRLSLDTDWSNFQVRLGVVQHRFRPGFLGLGGVDYPETKLYEENLEVSYQEGVGLEYRWIDRKMTWEKALVEPNSILSIPLRPHASLAGKPALKLRIEPWNTEPE
jgi:hypothetical protein